MVFVYVCLYVYAYITHFMLTSHLLIFLIPSAQLFLEVNGDDVKAYCTGQKPEIDCLKDDKNRMFIMELVLHCSDISNPFKPYALCAKWADLVVEEFCLQVRNNTVCAVYCVVTCCVRCQESAKSMFLSCFVVIFCSAIKLTLMLSLLQGDRERGEGLEISPMCDRTAIVLCNMQMGFIEFVVAPLIIG